MSDAQGLRVVLVAAALIALVHGLILKHLDSDTYGIVHDRPGRPHDGRPHPSLEAQFRESAYTDKDRDLREMFEFASQSAMPAFRQDRAPSDWSRCQSPQELEVMPPQMAQVACDGSSGGAGYVNAAVINRYANENPMNGGMVGGVGAYEEGGGFGGSLL